jgi:WD40 repeat protein
VAVAQMRSHSHVFCAPSIIKPRETAAGPLTDSIVDVAFSRGDGALVAAASWNELVQMRCGDTARLLWSVHGHDGWVWRCDFARDDTLLATASADSTVKLWRASDGSLSRTLVGHSRAVYGVACSPVADALVSGGCGDVKLWDIATGAEVHTLFPPQTDEVTSVAIDASGALVATGSHDGQIRLFDLRAGQLLHAERAHGAGATIWSLRFSAATGAPLLANASLDGTAKLWDLRRAREPGLLHTLRGHTRGVRTVVFSPDGALLVTASSDGNFCVWRVACGSLVGTIRGYCTSADAAAFHPRDASVLATCCGDRMQLWRL